MENEKDFLKEMIDEGIRNNIFDLGADDREATLIEEQMRRLSDIENERYRR